MKHKFLFTLALMILLAIPATIQSAYYFPYNPYSINKIEKLEQNGHYLLYIDANTTHSYNSKVDAILLLRSGGGIKKKLIAELKPIATKSFTVTDTTAKEGKNYYYFFKIRLKTSQLVGYSKPFSTKNAIASYQISLNRTQNIQPLSDTGRIVSNDAQEADWRKNFKLVCDEPCEISQKSLDDFKKVAWLSYIRYKELLDADTEESIKPIEIHIEPKGNCGDPWGAAYSSVRNGKGLICLKKTPFVLENGKKILHPSIKLDEPMSVLLHEFTHLVLWNTARGDDKLGLIEESFAQNTGHYVQNPVINGNYCGAKWNSPVFPFTRFIYELCQETDFNTRHLKQFFALAKAYMKNSSVKQRDFAQIIKTITDKDPSLLFDNFQF